MELTERQRKNWDYLVAAVQNPQSAYINACAQRYAEAIVAVNKVLDVLTTGKKVDSISPETVLSVTHDRE